jgi:hypothetical protein
MHDRLEKNVACSAGTLGFAHCQTRILQYGIGVATGTASQHDSHADAAKQFVCLDGVRLGQLIDQSSRDAINIGRGPQVVEQDRKFVTAYAGNEGRSCG